MNPYTTVHNTPMGVSPIPVHIPGTYGETGSPYNDVDDPTSFTSNAANQRASLLRAYTEQPVAAAPLHTQLDVRASSAISVLPSACAVSIDPPGSHVFSYNGHQTSALYASHMGAPDAHYGYPFPGYTSPIPYTGYPLPAAYSPSTTSHMIPPAAYYPATASYAGLSAASVSSAAPSSSTTAPIVSAVSGATIHPNIYPHVSYDRQHALHNGGAPALARASYHDVRVPAEGAARAPLCTPGDYADTSSSTTNSHIYPHVSYMGSSPPAIYSGHPSPSTIAHVGPPAAYYTTDAAYAGLSATTVSSAAPAGSTAASTVSTISGAMPSPIISPHVSPDYLHVRALHNGGAPALARTSPHDMRVPAEGAARAPVCTPGDYADTSSSTTNPDIYPHVSYDHQYALHNGGAPALARASYHDVRVPAEGAARAPVCTPGDYADAHYAQMLRALQRTPLPGISEPRRHDEEHVNMQLKSDASGPLSDRRYKMSDEELRRLRREVSQCNIDTSSSHVANLHPYNIDMHTDHNAALIHGRQCMAGSGSERADTSGAEADMGGSVGSRGSENTRRRRARRRELAKRRYGAIGCDDVHTPTHPYTTAAMGGVSGERNASAHIRVTDTHTEDSPVSGGASAHGSVAAVCVPTEGSVHALSAIAADAHNDPSDGGVHALGAVVADAHGPAIAACVPADGGVHTLGAVAAGVEFAHAPPSVSVQEGISR